MKANELDQKARAFAKTLLLTEGQLLEVLMQIRRQGAFAELNYTGIFDYCERALGLSRAQSYYFKSVAEKAVEVPELKFAVLKGEISLSQARRIAPVLTQENKSEWIGKAMTLPQVELERKVSEVNPKAKVREKIKPVGNALSELIVSVDAETEKDIEKLKDLLSQKLGKPASLSDVVKWATKIAREKFDPEIKAKRNVGKPISSGNELKKGRHPIPAAVKHVVISTTGFQCSHESSDGRRCETRRWLQFHHRKEVALGGLNTPENLTLLCTSHHKLRHLRF